MGSISTVPPVVLASAEWPGFSDSWIAATPSRSGGRAPPARQWMKACSLRSRTLSSTRLSSGAIVAAAACRGVRSRSERGSPASPSLHPGCVPRSAHSGARTLPPRPARVQVGRGDARLAAHGDGDANTKGGARVAPGSGIWLNVGRSLVRANPSASEELWKESQHRPCEKWGPLGYDTIQLVQFRNGYSFALLDCRGAALPTAKQLWNVACPPPHVRLLAGIPAKSERYAPASATCLRTRHTPSPAAVTRPSTA